MDGSGPVEFIPKGWESAEYQTFRYADGTTVLRNHPDMKGHMIRFIGDKGEVLVSRDNKLDTTPASLRDTPLSGSEIHLTVSDNHRDNWLDAIYTRGRPICDVEIGHRSCEICLLNGIAERLGRSIKWDPVSEQILGDPAAAQWMSRPRRAGYPLPV
jgi:hypothetical protein